MEWFFNCTPTRQMMVRRTCRGYEGYGWRLPKRCRRGRKGGTGYGHEYPFCEYPYCNVYPCLTGGFPYGGMPAAFGYRGFGGGWPGLWGPGCGGF